MKVLVIGNGAREHALIWKLRQSKDVEEIFCTMGNAGINEIAEPINIKAEDINSLIKFVKDNEIDFTVVGPEIPLSLGIVDEFVNNGLRIFGPTKSAARLETSKVFAKEFMKRYSIPTSGFEKFNINEKSNVLDYLSDVKYPVVIKADGLAAGKGVVICDNQQNAKSAIVDFFDLKIFGTAGDNIIIEEFLNGAEASVFAVSDGTNYIILPPARDHKKILDGEKGKNTGGMGSFAPAYNIVNDESIGKIKDRIIEPVLKLMKEEGNEFKGCLYCGLMIDERNNPYVIEFNVRFGDPETQVVLPLIKSDFLKLLLTSHEGNLKDYNLETMDHFCCSVVLSSRGYPDNYDTGYEISGLNKITDDCIVFHAATKRTDDGKVVSSGGRV
ncbi:MAG: phosphoribosylamine--glycine ligase, partial [Ignavibacteria bacterium]